jgi:ketosteroid isomerase-like protein
MNDHQAIIDRIEIEALQNEFTDAVMMNDHERLISLFVADGAIRIPDAGVEAIGHQQLRELAIDRERRFSVFVQTTHPGVVHVAGDTAEGRAHMSELIMAHDGTSYANRAIYHDRYQRTAAGWRFVERVYEVRYVDATPLPGGPGRRSGS